MNYLQLFLQNLTIELGILFLFFWREPKLRLLCVVLLANAFTHPWVVFGFLGHPGSPVLPRLLAAEFFAIVLEAFLYHKVLAKSFALALLASVLANLGSWELGPRLSFYLTRFGFYF